LFFLNIILKKALSLNELKCYAFEKAFNFIFSEEAERRAHELVAEKVSI
jgi:hypothetical protein